MSLPPPPTDLGANREVGTCWGDCSSHLIRHYEGLPQLPLPTGPPPEGGEGCRWGPWCLAGHSSPRPVLHKHKPFSSLFTKVPSAPLTPTSAGGNQVLPGVRWDPHGVSSSLKWPKNSPGNLRPDKPEIHPQDVATASHPPAIWRSVAPGKNVTQKGPG